MEQMVDEFKSGKLTGLLSKEVSEGLSAIAPGLILLSEQLLMIDDGWVSSNNQVPYCQFPADPYMLNTEYSLQLSQLTYSQFASITRWVALQIASDLGCSKSGLVEEFSDCY